MVVRIKSPNSLVRVMNYNEKKVQLQQATCIYAGNYLLNAQDMNFHQKTERLQHQMELNQRAKCNVLHISLNFSPADKLDQKTCIAIAETYMQKIGFGNQPFLVYEHRDAGHPHLHIVTTNITADGKRIDTFNLGRNQSEHARKNIEQQFNLIKAEGRIAQQNVSNEPAQKINYGKSETRRAISNVLDQVLTAFKYTSLTELNALLKQYNVVADRGAKAGKVYETNGLLYKLTDGKGKAIGVPVKASLFHNKPTLAFLEKRFTENQQSRTLDRQKLKAAIDWVLVKSPGTIEEFIKELQKEKIQAVLHQNPGGPVFGITFIDYRTKVVFTGSDVGKNYSIAAIRTALNIPDSYSNLKEKQSTESYNPASEQLIQFNPQQKSFERQEYNSHHVMDDLLHAEKTFSKTPFDFLKKKKKKRKNNNY